MKRALALLLLLLALPALLLGCAAQADQRRYSASFLGPFDTLTELLGYAPSEAAFTHQAELVQAKLTGYHRLFDIYHSYSGINNLKTINDQAGIAPVIVDGSIIDLLKFCKRVYSLSGGRVNVALGGVLALWHETREQAMNAPMNAALPDEAALRQAAQHADIEAIQIDEAASTVFLADPLLRLDVGAVAKGWAVERVAEEMPEGYLLSVGGNVRATGVKPASAAAWLVGVQDPTASAEAYLHTLRLSNGSVVTSGDYQRAYRVSGRLYHHIIDPATLYPAQYWHAVTVLCPDSALADALSTALFLMPLEEGGSLAASCGAEAVWVGLDDRIFYSAGYREHIQHQNRAGEVAS